MAYSKATFNDLLLSMSYRYGESSVPASGIDNRKYWINRGIEYCVERMDMTKSVSVTVVDGVVSLSASSSEPAPDFKSIVSLRDSSGFAYQIVPQDDYAKRSGCYATITGNHGDGYSLSAKNDGTYTLYYRFYTSPLVNTTDVCIIPDPEAVAAYAYAMIRKSETDPLEDADKNLEECDRRIDDMVDNLNRNEGDLTFKVLF